MRKILLTSAVSLLVLVAMVGARAGLGPDPRTLTVMFPSTTSLYQGAQVKVLGVRVGTVDSIEVKGTQVQVGLSYDPDVKLPEDVHAVIVPPSVVGDRFVQLAPAYTSGPVLEDDAHLDVTRAGVPLELEDTYRALDKTAVGLGPRGAGRDGALAHLISASAANMRGRGKLFNTTIRSFADAISTLAGSSDDINGTTTNLARFNHRLAASDATIRRLVVSLVAVSTELNGQGDELTQAVTALDRALGDVAVFTKQNRAGLRSNIAGLTSVSSALRRHTRELEEVTDLGPVGLTNLFKTYVARNWDPDHPGASTIDGRTGSQNLHAVGAQDLDTQLSYTMSAFCASLPAAEATRLAPFCDALEAAGGDIGRVILEAYRQGGPSGPKGGSPMAPSARELEKAQRTGAGR
jgi:phospholipid/cholesterol/gamma-HCH transport system substrate-binding protein